MILVDSSVWIDFFNARDTPQTTYLKASLGNQYILTADLVLAEVLQGTRSDRAFAFARDLLMRLEVVAIGGGATAVQAAMHYRALRARGITIRKTIDVLIATWCIAEETPLLYSDRDFDPFVAHLRLKSALDWSMDWSVDHTT